MTILEEFQLAKYAPWSSHQQPCSIAAESDPDIIRRRYTYLSSSRLWSLRRPGIKAIEKPLPSGSCSGYSSDGQCASQYNWPGSAQFFGWWTGQAPRRNILLCHAAPALPGLLANRILKRRLESVELSRPSMFLT